MSLFAGLDMENASDDPFDMPADFYDLRITEVGTKNGKRDPNKTFLVLEYTIENSEDGEYDGDTVQEWKWIPAANDETRNARQAKAYLKQRLASLGIPESRMDTVGADDLLNIEVTAYLERNGNFMNLSNKEGHFRLRNETPYVGF